MSDDLPDFSKDPTFTNRRSKEICWADCSECGETNYWTQPSKWDVEVLECWNCGTSGWVCKDIRAEAAHMYDCMVAAMDEKGRKNP